MYLASSTNTFTDLQQPRDAQGFILQTTYDLKDSTAKTQGTDLYYYIIIKYKGPVATCMSTSTSTIFFKRKIICSQEISSQEDYISSSTLTLPMIESKFSQSTAKQIYYVLKHTRV